MGSDHSNSETNQQQNLQLISSLKNSRKVQNIQNHQRYDVVSFYLDQKQLSNDPIDKRIANRYNNRSNYLIPIEKVNITKEPFYCGEKTKYDVVFKQCAPSLNQIIQEKMQNKGNFTHDEIKNIVKAVAFGLKDLRQMKQIHGRINLETVCVIQNQIRLKDPLSFPIDDYKKISFKGFPSPQKLFILFDKGAAYDEYFSDLFSLGMIAVKMYHLDKNIQELYKQESTYMSYSLDGQKLDQYAREITDNQLRKWVHILLSDSTQKRSQLYQEIDNMQKRQSVGPINFVKVSQQIKVNPLNFKNQSVQSRVWLTAYPVQKKQYLSFNRPDSFSSNFGTNPLVSAKPLGISIINGLNYTANKNQTTSSIINFPKLNLSHTIFAYNNPQLTKDHRQPASIKIPQPKIYSNELISKKLDLSSPNIWQPSQLNKETSFRISQPVKIFDYAYAPKVPTFSPSTSFESKRTHKVQQAPKMNWQNSKGAELIKADLDKASRELQQLKRFNMDLKKQNAAFHKIADDYQSSNTKYFTPGQIHFNLKQQFKTHTNRISQIIPNQDSSYFSNSLDSATNNIQFPSLPLSPFSSNFIKETPLYSNPQISSISKKEPQFVQKQKSPQKNQQIVISSKGSSIIQELIKVTGSSSGPQNMLNLMPACSIQNQLQSLRGTQDIRHSQRSQNKNSGSKQKLARQNEMIVKHSNSLFRQRTQDIPQHQIVKAKSKNIQQMCLKKVQSKEAKVMRTSPSHSMPNFQSSQNAKSDDDQLVSYTIDRQPVHTLIQHSRSQKKQQYLEKDDEQQGQLQRQQIKKKQWGSQQEQESDSSLEQEIIEIQTQLAKNGTIHQQPQEYQKSSSDFNSPDDKKLVSSSKLSSQNNQNIKVQIINVESKQSPQENQDEQQIKISAKKHQIKSIQLNKSKSKTRSQQRDLIDDQVVTSKDYEDVFIQRIEINSPILVQDLNILKKSLQQGGSQQEQEKTQECHEIIRDKNKQQIEQIAYNLNADFRRQASEKGMNRAQITFSLDENIKPFLKPPRIEQVTNIVENQLFDSQQIYPSEIANDRYVIEQNQQGVYEGYKLQGMRSGNGTMKFQSGYYYVGQWLNDKISGQGKMLYPDGTIAYQGQWAEGTFNGKGIAYNNQPAVLKQQFDYRNFNLLGQEWVSYEGHFKKDSLQGYGKYILSNDETYVGEFHNGLPHGNGTFLTIFGQKIVGKWHQGYLVEFQDFQQNS